MTNLTERIPFVPSTTILNQTESFENTMNQTQVEFNYLENPGDWRYLAIVVAVLVVILGTAGNGITVWAYARNKNLQTSFNVLIANLCLIELLFSIIVLPFIIPGFVTQIIPYPEALCTIVGYLYYSLLTASLHNLVTIAVNRYIGIVKPHRYQELFSGRRLSLVLASIWVTAPLLYLPTAIGGDITFESNSLRCSIGGDIASAAIKWYNLILNVTFQAIPLIILIILYTAILKKVKQVQHKLKEHKKSSSKSSIHHPERGGSVSSVKNRSGFTSDDTGDEHKPSSLVDLNGFKPIHPEKSSHIEESYPTPSPMPDHNENIQVNDSGPKSPDSTLSLPSKDIDDEAVQIRPKKRNSIWQLLLRNSQKLNSKYADSDSKSHSNTSTEQPQSNTSHELTTKLTTNGVVIRSNHLEIHDIRRKKSLSAPNLPPLDFTKLSPDIQQINEVTSPNSLQIPGGSDPELSTSETTMTRTRSAYYKRKQRENHLEMKPFKSKSTMSLRIKNTTKEWVHNLSMHVESDDESHIHRPRLGTIARKIEERKERRDRRSRKRKQRDRQLRRKHAREKQLVYSSLTICVAFAACILPTSLLFLIQSLFNVSAPAYANIIVSCISWLHAVVNPFIYGYLNSQYRREYTRILKCLKINLKCGKKGDKCKSAPV